MAVRERGQHGGATFLSTTPANPSPRPLSLHGERLRHLVRLWRGAAADYDSHLLHSANRRNEVASMY